jgi:hypothetical protein
MNIINHGPQCGFTVRMTAAELDEFAARWPCYDGPACAGWAAFTSDGDLIELSAGWNRPEMDGGALSAIIDDMKAAIAKENK